MLLNGYQIQKIDIRKLLLQIVEVILKLCWRLLKLNLEAVRFISVHCVGKVLRLLPCFVLDIL